MIKHVIGFCILSTILVSCSQSPDSKNYSTSDKAILSKSGGPNQTNPPNPMQVAPVAPLVPQDYKESLAKLPKMITDNAGFSSCLASQVNMCANSTVNNLAMNSENAEICNQLLDENMKGTCMSIVQTSLATKRDDEDLCDGINTEVQCRQNVITNRAMAKTDPNICESLRSKTPTTSSASGMIMPPAMDFADSCIMRVVVSVSSPDLELCENIVNDNTKTMCEQSVKSRIDMLKRQSTSSTGESMNGAAPSLPTTTPTG